MEKIRERRLPTGWYPVSKTETLKEIENFEKQSTKYKSSFKGNYGGVIPHAGWYFSGDLAAAVMRALKGINPE
ncbi:MAG: AmmeMemoRadiSam system protein B, partial [Candidatus Firestonebacteria bacterium]